MMSKFLMAAMLTTALAGTAIAQSASEPSTSAPATSTMTKSDAAPAPAMSTEGAWRSSKLVGLNVYNDGNEKLGAISDLILDKQGRIANVVIGIGGFLGMGEHNIAVGFNQLKWVDEPIKTTTSDARPTGGVSGSTGMGTGTVGSAATTAAPAKAWHPDHAVLSNATQEQLKAMPAVKY
jgi:sporulation protein YlmC with PRC-barrel domain